MNIKEGEKRKNNWSDGGEKEKEENEKRGERRVLRKIVNNFFQHIQNDSGFDIHKKKFNIIKTACFDHFKNTSLASHSRYLIPNSIASSWFSHVRFRNVSYFSFYARKKHIRTKS